MPSFFDLLQLVSQTSFKRPSDPSPALPPPPPPPRPHPPHLPIADTFIRQRLAHEQPRASPVSQYKTARPRPDSLFSLGAGSVVSPEDAVLLKQISLLLKERLERAYGEQEEEGGLAGRGSAPVRRLFLLRRVIRLTERHDAPLQTRSMCRHADAGASTFSASALGSRG